MTWDNPGYPKEEIGMGQELIDEAYALSQRLFALWSATEWPRFDGRVYRVFRRAANRAVRRMGANDS